MEDRVRDEDYCCEACAAAARRAETVSPASAAQGAAEAKSKREGGPSAYSLKRELLFFGAAAAAFALGMLAQAGRGIRVPGLPAAQLLFACAYLLAGRDVLLGAGRNILRGRVFDELFLMSVATLGAMAIGRYEEAVEVMAFYKVGEALQQAASARSRASVRALLALKPSTARLRRGGAWVLLDPGLAAPGDEFLVMPGERVALDGEV